jgi:hypothetical protein
MIQELMTSLARALVSVLRSRAALLVEHALLRQQVIVLKRAAPRPRLKARDRLAMSAMTAYSPRSSLLSLSSAQRRFSDGTVPSGSSSGAVVPGGRSADLPSMPRPGSEQEEEPRTPRSFVVLRGGRCRD